jgi:hypothetical protein
LWPFDSAIPNANAPRGPISLSNNSKYDNLTSAPPSRSTSAYLQNNFIRRKDKQYSIYLQ